MMEKYNHYFQLNLPSAYKDNLNWGRAGFIVGLNLFLQENFKDSA